MNHKIFLSFIFIIFLTCTFQLSANEKSVKQELFISTVSFNNINNSVIKYKSSYTDYLKKRKGMLALGGVGIGIMASGLIMEFAGGYIFGYYYSLESNYSLIEEIGGTVPQSWYYTKYFGLIIACTGSLLFLGGLAMTIAGFALARYYKNNTNSISLNTFTEFEDGILRTGFVLRL